MPQQTEGRAEVRRRRPCRVLVRPSFQARPAWLQELSCQRIGLVTHEGFAVGTALAVQLECRHADISGVLRARVLHVTQLPGGFWLLGCRLVRPLAFHELLALHGDAAPCCLRGRRP